jgi:hypothetical protein
MTQTALHQFKSHSAMTEYCSVLLYGASRLIIIFDQKTLNVKK